MNIQKRAEVVRAMETLARCVNDEGAFETWLMCGVADGDINKGTTDADLECYFEDNNDFAELMQTFTRIMSKAHNGAGLYVDGVCSKEEK